MDFRLYILLGIVYLAYSLYTRAKQKAAEQQKRTFQETGKQETAKTEPSEAESLFDKLRRLAEEAQAAAEAQQSGRTTAQAPQSGSGRPDPTRSAPMTSQEYPDEWVTTETGKQVRNLEAKGMQRENIKELYNNNRDDVRNVEGSMAEQLERYKDENKSTELSLTEEYLRSREHGGHVKNHGGKGMGKGMGKGKDGKRLNRFKEMAPMQIKRKATHPMKKELFSTQAVRRAFILKEVLDRPKGME